MTAVSHGPSAFSRFMASTGGRAVRLGIGLTLLTTGLLVGGAWGVGLAVFSALPIAAGTFNLCPIAPAWGGHFLGSRYCAAPKHTEK